MTTANTTRQCEALHCRRPATVKVEWPSSDPKAPHVKHQCQLHYEAQFLGRVGSNVKVTGYEQEKS